ncbi:unnamed protein product [Orchesella dallaii]|uniref:Uncharacterized protein n=1 Tax=Orchesella dallaii TaxID=48710 RepID=A0ABP1PIB4_9HEXA
MSMSSFVCLAPPYLPHNILCFLIATDLMAKRTLDIDTGTMGSGPKTTVPAASLASWSACSLPRKPTCAGIHINSTECLPANVFRAWKHSPTRCVMYCHVWSACKALLLSEYMYMLLPIGREPIAYTAQQIANTSA